LRRAGKEKEKEVEDERGRRGRVPLRLLRALLLHRLGMWM
jgi:hypothetical protein